jgi:hypothetical protein
VIAVWSRVDTFIVATLTVLIRSTAITSPRSRQSMWSGQAMSTERFLANDPRTIARNIPGIFDVLFPQLTPGVVAHFNRESRAVANCKSVSTELVAKSTLQRAMLFEIAVAVAEQLLAGSQEIDWGIGLNLAVSRQKRHFDAKLPDSLSAADKMVAQTVARNLVAMLNHIQGTVVNPTLVRSPNIPGYQWIASGVGDFSVGTRLIEVKCTNKHFSSADYRQLVMYWLLGYASSVENGTPDWADGILINPRLNYVVQLPFNQILGVISAGRSKVDLLAIFSSLVGDHVFQMLASIQ